MTPRPLDSGDERVGGRDERRSFRPELARRLTPLAAHPYNRSGHGSRSASSTVRHPIARKAGFVNILDRFEQSFERLLEGSIGRLLRSPIQPAEIGRKLERAMLANQVVSVDSTLVPNDYRVAMHPDDLIVFVDYIAALSRHMEGWLTEVAAGRGQTMIDRCRVQLVGDEGVPRRAIQVTAAIADRPDLGRDAQDAIQRTEVYRVIRATTGIPPLRLRFLSGPQNGAELILRKPVTTVGRALDNDIVIESGDVSRHHARIEYQDDLLRVTDLGSTNGTRVNGKSVRAHAVAAGDEITFGTLRLQLLPFDAGLGAGG